MCNAQCETVMLLSLKLNNLENIFQQFSTMWSKKLQRTLMDDFYEAVWNLWLPSVKVVWRNYQVQRCISWKIVFNNVRKVTKNILGRFPRGRVNIAMLNVRVELQSLTLDKLLNIFQQCCTSWGGRCWNGVGMFCQIVSEANLTCTLFSRPFCYRRWRNGRTKMVSRFARGSDWTPSTR